MQNDYSLIHAIRVLWKKKSWIISATILSAITGVIVSFVISEKYLSYSTFYPANPSLTDRQTLFSTDRSDGFIDYFGTTQDVNRIISIANSPMVANFAIEKFNLFDHYEINPDSRYPQTRIMEKFEKRFSVVKTELNAIRITFIDEDKQLASDLVNAVINKIDEVNKGLVGSNKEAIAAMFQDQIKTLEQEVDVLTDSLSDLAETYNIRRRGSGDAEEITYQGTNRRAVERYRVLAKRQMNTIEELNKMYTLSGQYEVSARDDLPSIFVIEEAHPAERKAKPIRWLVSAGFTLGGFFFIILALLIAERLSYIKSVLDEDE